MKVYGENVFSPRSILCCSSVVFWLYPALQIYLYLNPLLLQSDAVLYLGHTLLQTHTSTHLTLSTTLWLTVSLDQHRKHCRNLCSAWKQTPADDHFKTLHTHTHKQSTGQWENPYSPILCVLCICVLCERQWQGHTLSHNCRAELCGKLGKYRARQHCTLSHGCGYELAARKMFSTEE